MNANDIDQLKIFFEQLIQHTKLNGKNSRIEINPSPLDIRIDHSAPDNGRSNMKSKALILRLSEEFIDDHINNLVGSIPKDSVISFIDRFDFENHTQSKYESQPFEVFVITPTSEILPLSL